VERHPIQLPLPSLPIPECHRVTVGTGIEVLDELVRADDPFSGEVRKPPRKIEIAATPRNHGIAGISQIAIDTAAKGDSATAADENPASSRLNLIDLPSILRRDQPELEFSRTGTKLPSQNTLGR